MRTAQGKSGWSSWRALDAGSQLGLAASPIFALMAWVSALGAPHIPICSAAPALVPINDMALMYGLMSLFHVSPWIKLLSASSRRSAIQVNTTEGD